MLTFGLNKRHLPQLLGDNAQSEHAIGVRSAFERPVRSNDTLTVDTNGNLECFCIMTNGRAAIRWLSGKSNAMCYSSIRFIEVFIQDLNTVLLALCTRSGRYTKAFHATEVL